MHYKALRIDLCIAVHVVRVLVFCPVRFCVEVFERLEYTRSILVMWLECRFLDTEGYGSNQSIIMLCP